MKAAYADPPYIGQADKHYNSSEVNHQELIARMTRQYDCWALSCSSVSLQEILPLCPAGVRIGAWVKPFAMFKQHVNPAYAWEPVILHNGRNIVPSPRRERYWEGDWVSWKRDWIAASITLKTGLTGAKPPAFCYWLFGFMGLMVEDEFHDLFPGTGIVTECWRIWRDQELGKQSQLTLKMEGLDGKSDRNGRGHPG